MPKLKPCPHCGETDIKILTTMNGCDIWCPSCKARISDISYLEYHLLADVKKYVEPRVVDAWNRRVTE